MRRPALYRPAYRAAGADGFEVHSLDMDLILRKKQLPERIEIVTDVQAFETAMRPINEIVPGVDPLLPKIFGNLCEIVKLNHACCHLPDPLTTRSVDAGQFL
jgi:hypothetical protein